MSRNNQTIPSIQNTYDKFNLQDSISKEANCFETREVIKNRLLHQMQTILESVIDYFPDGQQDIEYIIDVLDDHLEDSLR